MQGRSSIKSSGSHIVVIGAGVGGLATALRLRSEGHDITVVDTHRWPGGKMRPVTSAIGNIDAGPTVLTMRHVFEDLFRASGARLDDHVRLIREPCLARHFWPDGSQLDLFDDREESARAIERFAGHRAAGEFRRYAVEAQELFRAFEAPMMRSGEPSMFRLAAAALAAPRKVSNLLPGATLAGKLSRMFTDPRLRQLFGRYATYVGGSPYGSPALISLVWRAEEAGVWRVEGGMHRLAEAMARRFVEMGGSLRLGTRASRIRVDGNGVTGVDLDPDTPLAADALVYAGDPRALATGLLGKAVTRIATVTERIPRSHSAYVWSFAARAGGRELLHHNVFFATSPYTEFSDIAAGRISSEPTVYVCAQDRGTDRPAPTADERFEIILNAAARVKPATNDIEEKETCRLATFKTLENLGLTFAPSPTGQSLTTPTDFEALFPGSAGALYGQSPHGMMASLKRPRARTAIQGLYLAGGGTHPGAGVPMAALSGKHAAEAIVADLGST
ncbi:MAG: phytoene desaturase family protein [Rhodobacter sp.]|nr:phytoene desaturase family protein [Rhodobacter sp.]